MLHFPKYIMSVSGNVVAADDYVHPKLINKFPNLVVAVQPRGTPEAQAEMIENVVDYAMGRRKALASARIVTKGQPGVLEHVLLKPITDSIDNAFPAEVSTLFKDETVSDDTVRKAMTEHLTAQVDGWNKNFRAPREGSHSARTELLRSIFDMEPLFAEPETVKKIWDKSLPKWLSGAVQDIPIMLVGREDDVHDGLNISTSMPIQMIYYGPQSKQELTKTLLEEVMHIAQDNSSYWQQNRPAIDRATEAFRKRILARDENRKFDQSPGTKRPRQLLKRNMDIDDNDPFWRYDKVVHANELIVDMAFIEAQLLSGAGGRRPKSQEAVNKIMQENFPEIYPHYQAFREDCMEMAQKNLPNDMPDKDRQELLDSWKAAPLKGFAKAAYAKPRELE